MPKKIITFKHFSGHEITVKSIQISSHHWISLQTKRKNYGNWYVCFCSNPSLYWKKYRAMAKFLPGFWTLVLNQGSFSLHYYVGTRNNSALNVRNQSYDGQIRLKCQNSGVLLSASSSRIFSQTPPLKYQLIRISRKWHMQSDHLTVCDLLVYSRFLLDLLNY